MLALRPSSHIDRVILSTKDLSADVGTLASSWSRIPVIMILQLLRSARLWVVASITVLPGVMD